MKTLYLHISLTYDPDWHDTPEERQWFINTIINNSTLQSHIIPQPIGTVNVIAELPPQHRKVSSTQRVVVLF
jgi:hypothetical protein